ncbi:MAG: glycolate oxidase subunit GlcF [Rhodospirillales bacterium]|nr:glycolate oxidase subunit GlcF [Rhodospirillales bacterium]
MQTSFTPAQLADADIREADGILRKCVHCGFCTATCPTYVLLGDELDSPRGRIYLIKHMLETDARAPATPARHLDRCLTCLSCMTTCPSGVNYMRLVDIARERMARGLRRPAMERMLRTLLMRLLPRPGVFRLALLGAALARPFKALLPGRLGVMAAMAPKRLAPPSAVDRPQVFPAEGARRKRVALMTGCAQQVLRPSINEATVRLLTRLGCEVVVAEGAGCCGALAHHIGETAAAEAAARANVAAWERVMAAGGLDAIVVNASGCGTTVKDYAFLLRHDPVWAERGARIASLARDVSEVIDDLGLRGMRPTDNRPRARVIAYHAACSLQHGQRVREVPKRLLAEAGFEVREPAESHLCCGSAGVYNILQADLALRLKERKAQRLAATGADVVATGNIGCWSQLQGASLMPVVHTVELLDWATGGPPPLEISPFAGASGGVGS